ncbi:MAG: phosphatase PAP2 family protein, partial [Gammaproteobacteria bacterium]|nr:phosphatase PAP2 family protein [Gammaproteobacteria bacterium]
ADANQYEVAGDVMQWILPLTAMGMTYMEHDPEGRAMFYQSFGATAGATYGIKLSVNRTRPNGADYSFPSGHTSASFSSAGFIHQRYGFEKGRWAYLAATFVGWSRIQAHKHYTSDVIAGAALGTLSSYFLTFDQNVDLSAIKDHDILGIHIKWKW